MKNVIAICICLAYVLSPNESLIQQGRKLGVKSIKTGTKHPVLQKLAEEHAKFQASIGMQGHQGWENRVSILYKKLPNCTNFREVANESWPRQSQEDAAKEMYNSWRQSPGHWSCVDGECDYYGYAMVLGGNGIWYSCGIFADKR